MMLKLVKEILEKVQLREEKKNEKCLQFNELVSQVIEKKKMLQEKERVYNLTLDDKVFGEIAALKEEIKTLQERQKLLSSTGVLEGNFRYPYDNEEAISELEKKLKGLNFGKLKKNILKSQEDYIKALREYESAVEKILDERIAIKSVEEHVEIDTLKAINDWFNANYGELHIDSTLKVGNTENNVHNVEEQLYASILNKVNNLWGGYGYDFESLKNN